MSAEKPRIIVKRIVKGGGGHHGGGWKIAFADLMTAMMAFFLVMWLLAAATPKQREGIAEHFRTPLKVVLGGGEKSSTSSSLIPGGGADPTRAEGEVKGAEGEAKSAEVDENADRMEIMKKQLDEIIDKSPLFKQFRPQILIDITSEGLRLQIVDSENRPMFQLASAMVQPHMRAILREIGPALRDSPNKITVSGHTDSTPYTSGDKLYSNWELSADRANASRRELVAGGMAQEKVLRVMGVSDSMPLDQADPHKPMNRRISIVVLNQRTQERIERENIGNTGAAGAGQLPVEAPRSVPTSR